jgi:drug/metabolite transporter (DMT)-like permease
MSEETGPIRPHPVMPANAGIHVFSGQPAQTAANTRPAFNKKAAALTLLSVTLWGFAPIGTRYMVGLNHLAVPALPFIGFRYLLAALVYAPLLIRAARDWSRADLALGALCGFIGIAGYNLPNVLGSRTVSAGMTGLLNAVEPLLIVLIAALAARRRPRAWTLFAGLIGLAGVYLLARGAGPALGDPAGIAYTLLGALLWSVYCVIVPPLIKRRGAFAVTAVTMAAGAIPMLILGAPGIPAMLAALTLPQWEITLSLVLCTSVIAILCWNAGSAGLGAEQAGWFLYLLPLISFAGGVVILGEPATAVEFFGGGLIMLSVFLSQRA